MERFIKESDKLDMKTPFAHTFEGPLGYYLYDVNTDSVVEITKETFALLQKMDCDKEIYLNTELKKMCESGLLSSHKVEVSLHPETPYLESYYARKLNYLILQVTQNCNLNCSYCVYSEKYYTRSHTSLQMSLDTAKRAIDYVFDRSADSKDFRIGFYGGEPLLNFDLIKQCVSYVKLKMRGEQAKYNITTNGTLLSESVSDYFIDNNFEVTISLDGPAKIHDVDRRFRSNGEGSFDIIIENLKKIQSKAPDYYRNNIRFNSVITTEYGFFVLDEFFNTNDQVKNNECSFGIVSDFYRNEELKVSRAFKKEYSFEKFKLLYSKVHEESTPYSYYLNMNYGGNITERLKKSKQGNLGNIGHHGGPCIPGVRRLFVSVDGTIYPCEKVIENSKITKLGDIYDGIDVERARTILNIERMQKTNCRSCWAYRYCSMCIVGYSDVCNQSDIYAKKRCRQIRATLEEELIDYITLVALGAEMY